MNMDLDLTFDLMQPDQLEAFGTGIYADTETAILEVLGEYGPQVVQRAQSLCPVNTGALQNSIDFDIDTAAEEIVIFSDMPYFPYVEFGTMYMPGHHMVEQAYTEYEPEILQAVDDAIAAAAEGYE